MLASVSSDWGQWPCRKGKERKGQSKMQMRIGGGWCGCAHAHLALFSRAVPVEHVGHHLDLSLGGSDFLLRRGLRAAAEQGKGHCGLMD